MKKLFSFIAAMGLAISAFATPIEIVFNDSTGLTGGDSGDRETTVAAIVKQGAEYVSAVTTDNVFRARENCGIKLGTGSKTGSLSMTLANPTEVDSIVFYLGAYSATEGSAVIMGGSAIDITPAGNKVFAPYVATPAGVVSEVSFASSAKRIYATKVVIYPKEGAAPAAANLFNAATSTLDTWFASGASWDPETESYSTWENGVLTTHIAVAKAGQWRAQVKLHTDGIALDPAKNYKFSFKANSVNALNNVTVKIFDNSELFYNSQVAFFAGNNDFVSPAFAGGATGNGVIVFDFGSAVVGDVITISEIKLEESTDVVLPDPAPTTAPEAAAIPEGAIVIYADGQTINPTWGYCEGWGQSTALEEKDFDGNHVLYYKRFNYLGWGCASTIDVTAMTHLHLDVWAPEAGALDVYPIYGGAGLTTDDSKKVTLTLAEGWNSVNVALADMEGLNKTSIFQFKFAGGTFEFFALDNVYFYAEASNMKTIYCKVDAQWWLNDGADVAVYCYKNGADLGLAYPGSRMDKVAGETNMWTAQVPADLDGLIFVRCNPVTADPVAYNWNAKTADLTLPTDGKNLYTITTDTYCWASDECLCAGEWSVYGATAGLSYELNGGVTNTYGWTRPADMFRDFMLDAGVAEPISLDEYLTYPEKLGAPGICAALTNAAPALMMEKWAWLKAYIESVHAAQAADGASVLPADGTGAAWRYAVGAFFIDGQRATWPKSANFTTCGVSTLAAYQTMWKGAFENPTSVEAATTLWAPYKEGYTFDGWYAAADFSGNKVTSIDATTTGTLYAKFIEYIPTIAEVIAMPENTATKAKGVVNFVNGKNLYIQDATGAILVYLSANPDAAVVAGKEILVSGTTTVYGGAPEIKSASVVSVSDGAFFPVPTKTIAELIAEPLKFFGQRVRVEGVKIASYDSYNNPYVVDGLDTVQCYKMVLDPAEYPVNAKVNITAVAGYYNKFQFVGDVAGIELASAAKHDTYAYPERDGATLENKWIYSNVEDNYADNLPGPADNVRGMAVKDGKMYFINRSNASITVVDGKTGYMLDPIMITGEHMFEAQDAEGNWSAAVTLPYNDIKFDNAGNCLIGACVSGGQHFMVYKVDLATGAATLVVDEKLYDNAEFGETLQEQATAWRFDAFGVYGDVNGDAVIMGADANSFNVYKWTITGGVAGTAEQIDASLDPTSDASLLITDGAVSVSAFGTAPQIFPLEGGYFYVDGWSTLPMLYDADGYLADDFINCPTGVAIANNPGDTCVMNQGHNGLCEFQVGDEYYVVMAATNTVGTPTSAFALYKYADANKSFAEMEPMWYFPANGMGASTNGCRTAVPSVEVKDNVARIYVYTNNNGYGVYEMTVAAPVVDEFDHGDFVPADGAISSTYFATTGNWAADDKSSASYNAANGAIKVNVVESKEADWQCQVKLNPGIVFDENHTYAVAFKAKATNDVNNAIFKLNDAGAGIYYTNFSLVANQEYQFSQEAIDGAYGETRDNILVFDFGHSPANTVIEIYDLYIKATPKQTAVENVEADSAIQKVVENGQVYIIKNGVRYTVLGAAVK